MDKNGNRVVVVDTRDKVIELKDKFAVHKNPVPLHRAISILIYSPDKTKVLLQKRSQDKYTWPGYWSNTCCSHPRGWESYLEAANRRLFEEMGIKTNLAKRFKFIYANSYNDTWGENELDCVFTGTFAGEVKSDPKEVAEWKWMGVGELKKDLKVHPNLYTPWFKTILEMI
jgi:isopentenyl-diphosphate delta-isomerase